MSEYERWVGRLYRTPLFHPSAPSNGMVRMKKLHGLLGNPMNDNTSMAIIHIAGTNGKGSVGLKLATTFQALGYPNVGLYSSPHVSCFRERIQWTNGELISEQEVAEGLAKLYQLCQDYDIPATFFELVTLLAFWFFDQKSHEQNENSDKEKKQKTIIVLETGLGGRWDATNVIEAPVLAIITSIGLDHTNILGNTHEQIALEKAGIMKPGSPVLVGYKVPHDTLRQYANEHGITEYHTTEQVLLSLTNSTAEDAATSSGGSNGKLQGEDPPDELDYDATNTRIVRAAISLLRQSSSVGLPSDIDEHLIEKATSVRPPCRFESICYYNDHHPHGKQRTNVILDVAHNPPGMQALCNKLRTTAYHPQHKTIRIVLGVSKDKDWKGVLEALVPLTTTTVSSVSSSIDDNQDHDGARRTVPSLLTKVHLVQAAHHKALSLQQLVQSIEDHQANDSQPMSFDTGLLHYNLEDPSVASGLLDAISKAQDDDELVVVCGSVFLMAEARRTLGIQEPCDSDYLTEIIRKGGRKHALGASEQEVAAFGNVALPR